MKRKAWPIPCINFDGLDVEECDEITLLGVAFHSRLTFASHVKEVAKRGCQRLGFVKRSSRVLGAEGIVNAYKGFVRPVLEYSVLTWMGAAESNLNKLEQVQARALRTCDKKVSIDSLCHRRKVSAASYLFKLKFMDPPELLRDLVPDDPKPSAGPARTRRAKEIELHGQKHQLDRHCNI